MAGNAALLKLLVITLLEDHRVDFDACETFGEARRRQADLVCRALRQSTRRWLRLRLFLDPQWSIAVQRGRHYVKL